MLVMSGAAFGSREPPTTPGRCLAFRSSPIMHMRSTARFIPKLATIRARALV